MDISLPVSDSSATGVFSGGGASTRSVDGGKFSQTLSKEMSGQHEQEPASGESGAAQSRQQAAQTAADTKRGDDAASNAAESGAAKNTANKAESDNTENTDENPAEAATTEGTVQTSKPAGEPGKETKKAGQEASDIVPAGPAATPNPVILPEEKIAGDNLKLLAQSSDSTPAESSDKLVTPSALDKAASPAASSVLANGSSNPALLRSNAIHNEIFNSARTLGTSSTTAAGVVSYADSLATGKSLQSSGKNLPFAKTEKAEQQLNSFLPAGAQDWKFTADSLITAVSDKSAKFEALTMQFDSRSAETFTLVNAGSGKTLLAPQPGNKNELAVSSVPLSSEFLAGSEEWCQDFGTKIEWLNNENITKAELSLHPAELGVLDITINTEDDRISINIVTHSEKSREMLESSLPRLTELLKSQGLALENSNISHNSSSDKQNAHAQQANPFSLTPEEKQAAELGTVRSALIRHQGQIDHYV